MIGTYSSPTQCKYLSAAVYCTLLLSVGLPQVRIQASTHLLYLAHEAKPDTGAVRPAQEDRQTRQIEPGKPIERELAGGQSHSYRITLAAGQYVKLIVQQRGIDVVARLFGPDGKQFAEFDSEIRAQGEETVEWVADEAGSYRIDLQSNYKYPAAGRYEIQVMELRSAAENDRALHEARKLYKEFFRVYRAGHYDEALSLGERVLAIRERVLGAEHSDVATILSNLGVLRDIKDEDVKAELLFQRALVIKEKAQGPEHPDVAKALHNLAKLYKDRGDFAKAESFNGRALAIFKKMLGSEHTIVAASLDNLGLLYVVKGDYVRAEPLFQQALAIREKVLGPEHLEFAQTLSHMARLYNSRGDYEKAELLYGRALAIWEKTLGPEHDAVAVTLHDLADLYEAIGDYAKAESFYVRAQAILEKRMGPEHPNVAHMLKDRVKVYNNRNDYTKAEPLIQRALAILEKKLEPGHPEVARALFNLAILYHKRGDHAKAEPAYERTLTTIKKVFGPEHPVTAEVLNHVAMLNAAKGDIAQAITVLARANAIDERNLSLSLAIGSERQKLALLDTYSKWTDIALSLQSELAPNNPQALDLAFTTLLCRKARGLDAMTDTIATLRRHAGPQDQALLERLAEARSQLAALILKEPDAAKPDIYRTRLDLLRERVEELEAELSSRSDDYRNYRKQTQPVTLTSVQAALPDGSALVEFACFTPRELQTEKGKPLHYLAYLLPAQGQPNWVDLGEAAPIDRAIDAWRKALRNPNRLDVKRLARAVDEMLMRPVRARLGEMGDDTRRLLIAPDGSLNLIPFAALVDEENQYLVERYSISYLISGRDLLRLQTSEPGKSPPLVVANPDFGNPATISLRGVTGSGRSRARIQAGLQFDPTQLFFQPLPATRYEAVAIKAILPQASVLQQEQATETALKQARGPRILHIATHGFFYNNKQESPRVKEDASWVVSPGTRGLASAQAPSYTVQLEARPELESAQERAKLLREQGVDAYLVKSRLKGKGILYRIRAGNFPTRAEAQKYGADLQGKGVVSEYFVARYRPSQAGLAEPWPMIGDLRLGKFVAQVKDPLLRSGLALAGANQGKSGDDDGVLTALEAAYLDLSGTKLVVLSACNTGVGDVKNGEGVQGLRRALVLAGSESQVMSLWPVSDVAAKDLMIPYYKALQEGEGRSQGLRQVQLRMLHGPKDRQHPFYWAAFIQSGEWANLDGQR